MGSATLNDNLQPIDSPYANRPITDSYQFDAVNERNAIGKAKIRDFSFSTGRGGTITLGGTANGNGLLRVLSATGGTVVTLNNSGINVIGGSISIQNSAGSTTFDSSGVVSLTNFTATAVSQAGGFNQVISGTAEELLTSGSLTFTLARSSLMLFLVNASSYLTEVGTTSTANGKIHLKLDGSDIEEIALYSGNNSIETRSVHRIREVAAGTHSFALTGNIFGNVGTPSMTIFSYRQSYTILGT